MTKAELRKEFNRVIKAYDEECRRNGNREGTNASRCLLAQAVLLQKFLIEYHNVNADFIPIKRHR